MTLPALLEQLIDVQTNPKGVQEEQFKKLRQEITATLSKGHQLRFNRLSFFPTQSFEDYHDDIPF